MMPCELDVDVLVIDCPTCGEPAGTSCPWGTHDKRFILAAEVEFGSVEAAPIRGRSGA